MKQQTVSRARNNGTCRVLTNARIVTSDEAFCGTVEIVGGIIRSLDHGSSRLSHAEDLEGDYLFPGFIDVHTDHLEKHAVPRAGTYWDGAIAAVSYDAVLIASGITTVFDSVCVGAMGASGKDYRRDILPGMIAGIDTAYDRGVLRADHYLHLRADVLEPSLPETIDVLLGHPRLRFVTVLEDSPRRNLRQYRTILRQRGYNDEAELERLIERARTLDDGRAERHRHWLSDKAARIGFLLGSHDDVTAEHAQQAAGLGMTISEFPLTHEAASAARKLDMSIVAGAPNIVRGGSHAGNAAVKDLIQSELVDILSSDYVPASILQAIFHGVRTGIVESLPEAVALATHNPARIFGLDDRGRIAPDMRADLVRVSQNDANTPLVRSVWVEGRAVVK